MSHSPQGYHRIVFAILFAPLGHLGHRFGVSIFNHWLKTPCNPLNYLEFLSRMINKAFCGQCFPYRSRKMDRLEAVCRVFTMSNGQSGAPVRTAMRTYHEHQSESNLHQALETPAPPLTPYPLPRKS